MNPKIKIQKQTSSAVKHLIICAGISLAITALMGMLTALLIQNEKIPEETMGYAVMVMLLLSSYIGSLIACKKQESKNLSTSVITGGVYWALLLIIGVLCFDGTLQAVGETILLILCGSILAAMWTSRGNRKKKFRKFKISNR